MQSITTRTLCDACLAFPLATASTVIPASLKAISDYAPTAKDYTEAKFQCHVCNTIWLHRKNKWGICEGFRLNP